MRNDKELDAMQRMFAERAVLEWMDELIDLHERGAKSLRERREQFVEACKGNPKESFATPVSVLAWTVNEVNNIRMNGRLDLAVNHAAALALTAKKGE